MDGHLQEPKGSEHGYCYEPLDHDPGSRQFRLLGLFPARAFEAEIRCQVFQSSLDDHPEYEALSYAGGDPNVTMPILFHGHKHQVTTNLELALHYIRFKNRERIMWIDALCISQKATLERIIKSARWGTSISAQSKSWCG
jgi:hypothetical protein